MKHKTCVLLLCLVISTWASHFEFEDAEAPVHSRKDLIFALSTASEIEHSVMAQYLYAAASLKTELSEFTHATRKFAQYELVRKWKNNLLFIAREEMQHWSYVCMIMDSLGADPTVSHKPFPFESVIRMKQGNSRIEMSLQKFDMSVLQKFIQVEAKHTTNPLAARLQVTNDTISAFTLSDLYLAIRNAIKQEDHFMERTVHIQESYSFKEEMYNTRDQIRERRIHFPYKTVTRVIALKMITEIIEDAEGADKNIDPDLNKMNPRKLYRFTKIYQAQAHENILLQMREEYEEELAHDPMFDPSRNVMSNPQIEQLSTRANLVPSLKYRQLHPQFKENFDYKVLKLFEKSYQTLLVFLRQWHTCNADRNTLHAMTELIFMPFMTELISPLMYIITSIKSVENPLLYLGPTFSLSKLEIPERPEEFYALHVHNLEEMIHQAASLLPEMLSTHPTLHNQLAYIHQSMELFLDEFKYRSASPEHQKPISDDCIDRRYNISTVFGDEPTVLQINFRGHFQCRLPTDPDSSTHTYGMSGQTFAPVGDPPLDRIIRFQNRNGAVHEPFTPKAGVFVDSAYVVRDPFRNSVLLKDVSDKLVGAEVDLLGSPKFEGRNHILSAQKETIDPFTIQIKKGSCGNKFLVQRAEGSPSLFDMSVHQRKLANLGRDAFIFPFNDETAKLNLATAGVTSALEYTQKRFVKLQRALDAVELKLRNQPHNALLHLKRAQYAFRIENLKKALDKDLNDKRTNIRLFFMERSRMRWNFTLAGDAQYQIPRSFGIKQVLHGSNECDTSNRWVVQFDLGFFDYDAKVGAIEGKLLIPVQLQNN